MRMRIALFSLLAVPGFGAAEFAPVVEIEEDVYSYADAGNGAGPMWCAGSTTVGRIGADVFVSGLETVEGVQPINNCRWRL